MATRSLTEVFILMRNNSLQSKHIFAEQAQEDTVALVSDQDVEMGLGELRGATSPPRWLDALEEVNYQMTKIKEKLKELSELHDRHLNRPTFDETSSIEQQIEHITQELAQLFNHCQQLLAVIQQGARHGANAKESHLAQNVVRSVAGALQSLTSNFRNHQIKYCKGLKQRDEHSSKFFDVPFSMEETSTDPFRETKQNLLEDQLFLKDNTEMVKVRSQEVNYIMRSIADLNTIFKDIATMVAEQGTVLDRIDYNIDTAQVQVHQGLQQLQKAASYQKKNHKMLCILVMAASTIVLIILLFAYKL
ncbi:syntaxin-16-like [Ornithodoros turicata]|uniref:Putative snare protein tlg2/syntaxin 16 n=1 Tax=Ornithodoros turicata TaxID=34597 RepID=A0A2R5LDH9_9ACAR